MTAPVQMTHSSTSSLVEPRGLRRIPDLSKDPSTQAPSLNAPASKADPSKASFSTASSSKAESSQSSKAQSYKAQSENLSGTGETSPSDDSMNSLEDGYSAVHPSFGSILRQYVATPSGGRTSQSNQIDTSQPKKDSVEPDPLATAPDRTMGRHREILPLRLAMLSPNTPPAVPEQDSTNAQVNSTHTEPMNTGSTHPVLETAAVPSGSVSLPQPTAPQAALANPDARSGDNSPAPQPQLELAQATTPQTVTVQTSQAQTLQTETAPAQASPIATAPAPESMAFAVRLAPTATAPADEANTKAPETSSARPQTISSSSSQTSSPVSQREMPAPDAAVSVAQPADPSADRLAMINTMPNLAHTATPNGPVSSPAKSDAHPVLTSSALRAEPVTTPPAAPSGSSRDFTVRIPDATDRGTNVRFVERGSEVHVSVRTADSELAQLLRGGLGDLTGRLQHSGVQAEVWRPGSDTSHSDSQSQSSESKDQGGRRHQSGAQRDGQDQPNEDKPRWVEELESFGEPVGR
jgi:hypothetical protein